MTDASQNVVRQYQYDAYGKILQQTPAIATDDNPFRYVGQHGVQYEEQNLYFMRARYYDPNNGKFLSEDPIWSTNLFAYGDNNPIISYDSEGKNTTPAQAYTDKGDLKVANELFDYSKEQVVDNTIESVTGKKVKIVIDIIKAVGSAKDDGTALIETAKVANDYVLGAVFGKLKNVYEMIQIASQPGNQDEVNYRDLYRAYLKLLKSKDFGEKQRKAILLKIKEMTPRYNEIIMGG